MTTLATARAAGRAHFETHFDIILVALFAVAAVLLVGLASMAPPILGLLLVGALMGAAVTAVVIVWPPAAAYFFLATMPFLAGVERGAVLPLVRPNEAVQFLLGGALIVRALALFVGGHRFPLRLSTMEIALLVMAICGSFLPLGWLVIRERGLPFSEILATVPLWRYVALYLLIRMSISTEAQVRTCLWIGLLGACAVSLIAIAQVLNIGPTQAIINRFWTPGGVANAVASGRGTATLSSSHATGDVLSFNIAVVLGLLLMTDMQRLVKLFAIGVAALLVLGTLASAQFSGALSLMTVLGVVAITMRRVREVLIGGAVAAFAGGILLWPVISIRLSEFGDRGLPQSWAVRFDNLATFYIPDLVNFGWILGVRPDSVVPAPEDWRVLIFLESGYLWLLWVGGVPLLLSFIWFVTSGMRQTFGTARLRNDAIGVAALGGLSSLAALTILMLFDPHLTIRGAGDTLFTLLALAAVPAAAGARASNPPDRRDVTTDAARRLEPRGALP
ncbi:MAG: hypothetical protein R3C39_00285 [Dehalococcoidia bacterium]